MKKICQYRQKTNELPSLKTFLWDHTRLPNGLSPSPVPMTVFVRSKLIEVLLSSTWMALVFGMPVILGFGGGLRAHSAGRSCFQNGMSVGAAESKGIDACPAGLPMGRWR